MCIRDSYKNLLQRSAFTVLGTTLYPLSTHTTTNLRDEIKFTNFNPILHGGGHYGPDDQRSPVVSLWIALCLPNFFTLFLSMFYKSQKSHFQKKKKFREKYRTLSKISIYDMQAISFLLAWVWLRPQNANVRGKNTTLNCQKQSC